MTAENTAAHIAHEMERRRNAEERIKQLEGEIEAWRKRWHEAQAELTRLRFDPTIRGGPTAFHGAGSAAPVYAAVKHTPVVPEWGDLNRACDRLDLTYRTADEPTGFRDWPVTEDDGA